MTRPNILIFMPDQLRADSIGCFGNPVAQTPNIDTLAREGTRFDNAWVNHPVCGPSRVNLMTGWYPHTHGHRTLTHLLSPDEPNMLRYLKDGGYQVAFAGARGDVFAPGVTESSTHFCGFTTAPKNMGMGPQYESGSALYNAFYHGARGEELWLDFDEAVTRTAIDWLQESPAEPWCLWMPLIFPHLPFEVEEPWYSMYRPEDMPQRNAVPQAGKPGFHEAIRQTLGTKRLTDNQWREIQRVYYGMVSRVDWQLGRVLQTLEATDQRKNTMIIFLTDHGEYLGDFDLVEKWPSGLDRCLTQNPLIMAGPDIASGAVANTFAEMVDVLPTVLEVAEIEVQHTHFGRSLVPALRDHKSSIRDYSCCEGGFASHESHLLEQAQGEYARKAQLQRSQPELVGKAFCLRTEQYSYVYRQYEQDELYDRLGDPSEMNNLLVLRATDIDCQSIASEMKSQLMHWLVETTDEIPWTPDPRFPRVPKGQHQDVKR